MKLDSIELRDFRGISNLCLTIDDKLTVIVGDNGIGKTSILDAICYSLSALRSLWSDKKGQPGTIAPKFSSSDIALTKTGFTIKASAHVKSTSSKRENITLSFSGNRTTDSPVNFPALLVLSKDGEIFTGRSYSAQPLFVYYRQNRTFKSNDRQQLHYSPVSEDQVHEQSLSKDLRAIQDLSTWWDKLDAQEARRHRDEEPGYRDPQLEAIRNLIGYMDEFEDIAYEAKSEKPGLYLRKNTGLRLHVDQLSSGERAYLILLADLARRLQIVQSDAVLSEIPGIVLIDEIELNLHPNWQRLIIPTLTRVFKRCQFIITTHSPQVLGEIKDGRILALYRNKRGEIEYRRSQQSFGRDSNDILIDVLGSTERDADVKTELENLESLISRRRLNEARKVIDELRLKFEGRPVELEIAEQRLRRRERRSKE